jgi:vitamin B12 transporter
MLSFWKIMKQFKKQPDPHQMIKLVCSLVLGNALFIQQTYAQSTPQSLDIVVTGTRSPIPVNESLTDTVVITSEEIQNSAQSSLTELLQNQRGIQVSSYGGSGSLSSINLRGTSNSQSILIIDGVRVESSSGGALLSVIPLNLIDRIEIVYGPQSTMYGANALGGVVQLFTKTGNGPNQFSASTGFGSYGTSINTLSTSGSIEGEHRTTYSFGLSQEHSAGFNTIAPNNVSSYNYRLANGYDTSLAYADSKTGYTRLGLMGNVTHEWSKKQEIGLRIYNATNNNAYPGNSANSYGSTGNNDGSYSGYQAFNALSVNRFFSATLFSKNQLTTNWQSIFQVSKIQNSGQNLWPNVDGSLSNDIIETPQYDFTWQNNITLGTDLLQILIERRLESINANYTYNQSGCADNCNVSASRSTNSIAGSYLLKEGNNRINGSVRMDNSSSYGTNTTGGLSYGYLFSKEWKANVSYGTGWRMPTYTDLYYPGAGNISLIPEKSKNLEGGIAYFGKALSASLNIYRNEITNYIEPYYNNPSNLNAYPINIGSVRIQGVSIGSAYLYQNFKIRGSIDDLSAIDQNSGTDLPRRAKFSGNINFDYTLNRFNMGLGYIGSGQRYDTVDNNQAYSMSPYALLNMYASYRIDKDIKVFARWNNMLNSNYQTIYGYNNPGSNFFMGIRFDN